MRLRAAQFVRGLGNGEDTALCGYGIGIAFDGQHGVRHMDVELAACRGKETGLLIGIGDALDREIEIILPFLNADESAAEFRARHTRGAGTHEGIEDSFPFK